MTKIVFDHVYGLQSQAEVYHYAAALTEVGQEDHDMLLDQGWLATAKNNEPHWYQSRSTRCCLAETNYSMLEDYKILNPLPAAEMDHIYSAYCFYKKYKKYFEIGQQLSWDLFMGYDNSQGELVAWSKLRKYSPLALETVLFVWDYKDPGSKLGVRSLEHELAWAKQQGYQYVYMGPGYERMNKYKAAVQGFEWWTGRAWSQDRAQYLALCERDSRISQCVDLHDLKTAF